MLQFTFNVGLADKDAMEQIIPTAQAWSIIEQVFVEHDVDGATITEGRGIYRHENGSVVRENSVRIEVLEFDTPVNVRGICTALKVALNQESIAVKREEVDSFLV